MREVIAEEIEKAIGKDATHKAIVQALSHTIHEEAEIRDSGGNKITHTTMKSNNKAPIHIGHLIGQINVEINLYDNHHLASQHPQMKLQDDSSAIRQAILDAVLKISQSFSCEPPMRKKT